MKKVVLLSFMFSGSLFAGMNIPQPSLPLDTETNHFKLYCMANDKESAQKVLAVSEKNFSKLSADFKHEYSTKINLYVFPSVQEHHDAIGSPSAPNWRVNTSFEDTHSFFTVSPDNPGSYHSTESILNGNIIGLTHLFIKDMPAGIYVPRWFCLGVGLWMAGRVSKTMLFSLASDHTLIPSMEQLGELEQGMRQSCSYSIVDYINQQWGWETILSLIADFSSFEKILGITQETFRTQWISYLDATYLG